MRLAALLWSGSLGGAETFTVDLCHALRGHGAETGVVFVTDGEPLARRLDAFDIPNRSLGLARGRDVLFHPQALAKLIRELGPDGVLAPRAGYLTAALRAGGYRGRVVAVAHDAVFDLGPVSFAERLEWRLDRASGYWASNVDVAVSDFALAHMRGQLHAKRLVRIYNGVDLERYTQAPNGGGEVVAFAGAGRLVAGKGFDMLIRAFAAMRGPGMKLRIAGDGPTFPQLRALAADLGLNASVEFVGPVSDIASFWAACDVAVQPSAEFVESFGMAAVEAMACARPVVATRNGALPEVVEDGVTGAIVPIGDIAALAEALRTFAGDAAKTRATGAAARRRCEERFDIRACAANYIALFDE
jgi:glycosyltransferase involved in cell wall biosynthesis